MSRSESWILGEPLNHLDDLRDDYHDLFGNIAVLVDPGACHCRPACHPIYAVASLLFSRMASCGAREDFCNLTRSQWSHLLVTLVTG